MPRPPDHKDLGHKGVVAIDGKVLRRSFARAVRGHWGIENRLHWVLDVTMGEDLCRTRKYNGAHNLAVLGHMALNIISKEPAKGSESGKFRCAGWDDGFLLKLLAQI